MSRPTPFGVPSIIGTSESLATTMSWPLTHMLVQGPLSCNQSSTSRCVPITDYFKWPVLKKKSNLSQLCFYRLHGRAYYMECPTYIITINT